MVSVAKGFLFGTAEQRHNPFSQSLHNDLLLTSSRTDDLGSNVQKLVHGFILKQIKVIIQGDFKPQIITQLSLFIRDIVTLISCFSKYCQWITISTSGKYSKTFVFDSRFRLT